MPAKTISGLQHVLRHGLSALAIGSAALLALPAANASLLDGKTVSFTYLFPTASSVYGSGANGNYVVGAGVEIPNGVCCGFEGAVDISDSNIRVDFHASSSYSSAAFNGFRISDVFNTIDDFTMANLNAITNMSGFGASNVTFDANNIYVNWQGLPFASGRIVSIDLAGSHLPEPGALSLLALALLGLGLGLVRRQRN